MRGEWNKNKNNETILRRIDSSETKGKVVIRYKNIGWDLFVNLFEQLKIVLLYWNWNVSFYYYLLLYFFLLLFKFSIAIMWLFVDFKEYYHYDICVIISD